MQFRRFGKTQASVSNLSFECMRLPIVNRDDLTSIDMSQATKLIRTAIEQGVNYIDMVFLIMVMESVMAGLFCGLIR